MNLNTRLVSSVSAIGRKEGEKSSPAMSSGVTRRPQAGSAYGTYGSQSDAEETWKKIVPPGGRKLWCHLVTVFTVVGFIGLALIALGAAYFRKAYAYYEEEDRSMPLVCCIFGIVGGVLMVIGTLALSRLFISDKWRKNEQPVYASTVTRVAGHDIIRDCDRNHSNDEDCDSEPPPYDPINAAPPSYSLSNLQVATQGGNTGIILAPPSYIEAVNNKPPGYTLTDPLSLAEPQELQSGSVLEPSNVETVSRTGDRLLHVAPSPTHLVDNTS